MVKLVRTSKRHRWNNFTLCNTDQGCKKLYYNKKFRDLKSFFVLGGSIVHTSDGASASADGEENMTRFQYRHLKRKRKRRRMQGNKNFAVSCVFVGACICNCISHVWTLSMQTQPNTKGEKGLYSMLECWKLHCGYEPSLLFCWTYEHFFCFVWSSPNGTVSWHLEKPWIVLAASKPSQNYC